MFAELFQTKSFKPTLQPAVGRESGAGQLPPCDEKFRLKAEYIRRLAEFNEVSRRHKSVVRAGLQGRAAEESWRAFEERCVACRAAWDRYRKHVAAHSCKHGVIGMSAAA